MSITDAEKLIEPAIELAGRYLTESHNSQDRAEKEKSKQMADLIGDEESVRFAMNFVDRIARTENNTVGAKQLSSLVKSSSPPAFLGAVDKLLLRCGALLGPIAPDLVMPLARRRLRFLVGHLIAPAETPKLTDHLNNYRSKGYDLNVNLLGEAVLGETEAAKRLADLLDAIKMPEVDYVSVKLSSVASQLNYWDHPTSLSRVSERLELLLNTSLAVSEPTFINFDMEEYHDLSLTTAAFKKVLGMDEFGEANAGIVLQTYLPDSFEVLQDLVEWANKRHAVSGGQIKIRLVKGANLAMEQVDAEMHGWVSAPYPSKAETDANFKRCLDWVLTKNRTTGVSVGVATHNLFDSAWTFLLATERNVIDRVQFEMLLGMAPSQAMTVKTTTDSMLLYTPAVADHSFDVAVSYLLRRLEENSAGDNFLRHIFDLKQDSAVFSEHAKQFGASVRTRLDVSSGPRRKQNRLGPVSPPYEIGDAFVNEPETDPALSLNQDWIASLAQQSAKVDITPKTKIFDSKKEVDKAYDELRRGQRQWASTTAEQRQQLLHKVALELSVRRPALIATMVAEAAKTYSEADAEVCEAIDFARWYGDRALDLEKLSDSSSTEFIPRGVYTVVPPWNFPTAIPAGGTFAALAAGNTVLLKPSPEVPMCSELVVDACRAAGLDSSVVQLGRSLDDHIGRHLICSSDALILTGSLETAQLFQSWRPDLPLIAETSGKNSLIVTDSADIDLAVSDLVESAFGHSGQKCSAASLCILVGKLAESPRFLSQLKDATEGLSVGSSLSLSTTMGPVIGAPNDRLKRALTKLDDGEAWLVEPQCLNEESNLWSPGIKTGVDPAGWFAQTECFGPVLGLVAANDLAEAIAIQNSSKFGLTGGLHSLNPEEIEQWTNSVEVGNAYINRSITGAIVGRQPFGGWKRSSIGEGSKAGGQNYLFQLGLWKPKPDANSATNNDDDYAEQWRDHFSLSHDPIGLKSESNSFRYLPLPGVILRAGPETSKAQVELAQKAAEICGTPIDISLPEHETDEQLAERLGRTGAARIRFLGSNPAVPLLTSAAKHVIPVIQGPVLTSGRVELRHFLYEQVVTKTAHRFGNFLS